MWRLEIGPETPYMAGPWSIFDILPPTVYKLDCMHWWLTTILVDKTLEFKSGPSIDDACAAELAVRRCLTSR